MDNKILYNMKKNENFHSHSEYQKLLNVIQQQQEKIFWLQKINQQQQRTINELLAEIS